MNAIEAVDAQKAKKTRRTGRSHVYIWDTEEKFVFQRIWTLTLIRATTPSGFYPWGNLKERVRSMVTALLSSGHSSGNWAGRSEVGSPGWERNGTEFYLEFPKNQGLQPAGPVARFLPFHSVD